MVIQEHRGSVISRQNDPGFAWNAAGGRGRSG